MAFAQATESIGVHCSGSYPLSSKSQDRVFQRHFRTVQRVPVEMARQLYAAAPQPKSLLLIEGGEHNNSSTVGWIEYRDAVSGFVKKFAR